MHTRYINERNRQARQTIREAAGALADALALPPLETPTAIEQRDPAVAQMRELECVAALLASVAAALLEGDTHERQSKESRAEGRSRSRG